MDDAPSLTCTYGRQRTAMDTAAMTTDQKIGCSSHPERAEFPQVRGINDKPMSGLGGTSTRRDGCQNVMSWGRRTHPSVVEREGAAFGELEERWDAFDFGAFYPFGVLDRKSVV